MSHQPGLASCAPKLTLQEGYLSRATPLYNFVEDRKPSLQGSHPQASMFSQRYRPLPSGNQPNMTSSFTLDSAPSPASADSPGPAGNLGMKRKRWNSRLRAKVGQERQEAATHGATFDLYSCPALPPSKVGDTTTQSRNPRPYPRLLL